MPLRYVEKKEIDIRQFTGQYADYDQRDNVSLRKIRMKKSQQSSGR
jgi:hypothetical protein